MVVCSIRFTLVMVAVVVESWAATMDGSTNVTLHGVAGTVGGTVSVVATETTLAVAPAENLAGVPAGNLITVPAGNLVVAPVATAQVAQVLDTAVVTMAMVMLEVILVEVEGVLHTGKLRVEESCRRNNLRHCLRAM